ncbi:hypothetical protein ACE38W_14600 [Chitinophaga sp. Hz27]|uniref:hypothetical protein n=1 Tax=Chitinophaga sp. Hz27 TaxID=3347169 RepID=UPI0035E361DF
MILLKSQKAEEIRKLLKNVEVKNIVQMLHHQGVLSNDRHTTVYEVLRGESDQIFFLEAVVKIARVLVSLKAERAENI